MRTKRVGKIDWDFSVIGFGCWGASGKGNWTNHSDEDQIRAIQKAMELGINFFDVAPIYGYGHAEEVLGKAVKGHRDEIFIASKVGLPWTKNFEGYNDVSAESILREIDDSLKRLNVDYLDLYQVHWPTDKGVPLEETMEAMAKIKASGKAKYIGLSNYSLADLEKANDIVDIASMQGLFNMLEPDADSYHNIPLQYRVNSEVLPKVIEEGMAFLPYSPMFQGLLAGKIAPDTVFGHNDVRNHNPKLHGEQRLTHLEVIEAILKLPALDGRSISEVAINYLVAKKGITSVIATQANESEVIANVKALEWELNQDTLEDIEKIVRERL